METIKIEFFPIFIVGVAVLLAVVFFLVPRNPPQPTTTQRQDTKNRNKKSNKKKILREQQFAQSSKSRAKIVPKKETEELSGYVSGTEEDEVAAILEFIKGKDATELMRKDKVGEEKKNKHQEKDEVPLDALLEDSESEEEYIVIKRKKVTKKTDTTSQESKGKKKRPFFKPELIKQLREERRAKEKEKEVIEDKEDKRKSKKSTEEETNTDKKSKKPKKEDSQEEKKEEKKEGKGRKDHSKSKSDSADKESEDPKPKRAPRENPDRPPRPPRTFQPIVATPLDNYEPPSLEDTLNSMMNWFPHETQSRPVEKRKNNAQGKKFNQKPASNKSHSSQHSNTPRKGHGFDLLKPALVISILDQLSPTDLANFAKASPKFNKYTHYNAIWKNLCKRDFGITEKTGTWKDTYQTEFAKKK